MTCKQDQERIEESVLQPIDRWVQTQEQRCKDEPCNWWTLCLNKLFCWLAWVLVKICEWVLTIVVRWVYRWVCTVVTLVFGLLALLVGNTSIISGALGDLWEVVKDSFYTLAGAVIFIALRIVDLVQTAIGRQPPKRALTEQERGILYPIFRDSLNYKAIAIVDGNAGILGGSGRAFTMGFTIYLPTYSVSTLVHECVHAWQFEFEGFKYIGNSALNQLDSMTLSQGYQPYAWQGAIDTGGTWYTLKSVEAQAQFVEDVFDGGAFVFTDPAMPSDRTAGAFFRENEKLGMNQFVVATTDYTKVANDMWKILRTA